jgi:hypothetical protein
VLAYSVEKLSDRDQRKNPTALESLKFPRAEGTAALDDLRAQIRSASHASRFPRILGRILMQLKIASVRERSFSTESAGTGLPLDSGWRDRASRAGRA